eukprot:4697383-Pyramimonas_sp.AAC.1
MSLGPTYLSKSLTTQGGVGYGLPPEEAEGMNLLAPESTRNAPPQPSGRSAAAGTDSRGERRPDVRLPPI